MANPFEGVKIVSDYDNNYVLSVVLVKSGTSESAINRIAQVKSQRQGSQYLNGVVTTESETIIRTTEKVKMGKSLYHVLFRAMSWKVVNPMQITNSFPMVYMKYLMKTVLSIKQERQCWIMIADGGFL